MIFWRNIEIFIEKSLVKLRKVRYAAQTLPKCCTREYIIYREFQPHSCTQWGITSLKYLKKCHFSLFANTDVNNYAEICEKCHEKRVEKFFCLKSFPNCGKISPEQTL